MSYLAWCHKAIPGQSWTGEGKRSPCYGERQSMRVGVAKLLAELKQRIQATTGRFILEGAAETRGRTNEGEVRKQ